MFPYREQANAAYQRLLRFALILELMCKAVACCGGPRPTGPSGLPVQGHPGPLLTLICTRLCRIIARFTRAATTPQAPSRLRAKRPFRPRPLKPLTLPRNRAWLLLLIPEAAGGASQLRYFFNDPEVVALIAADPRLGRILRPLCHMLGIRRDQVPLLWQPPPQSPSQPPGAPPPTPPTSRNAAPLAEPAAFPPAETPPWTTPPSRSPPGAPA